MTEKPGDNDVDTPSSSIEPPTVARTGAVAAAGGPFSEKPVPRRQVWSWALWDWATQPFNTVILLYCLLAVGCFLLFTVIDLGSRERIEAIRAGSVAEPPMAADAREAYIAEHGYDPVTEDHGGGDHGAEGADHGEAPAGAESGDH